LSSGDIFSGPTAQFLALRQKVLFADVFQPFWNTIGPFWDNFGHLFLPDLRVGPTGGFVTSLLLLLVA
jgi:hypothetical protein